MPGRGNRMSPRGGIMRKAIRNGMLVDETEASLPVTDRAVQYSYSVYESLKMKNGEFVHLPEHMERLCESMEGVKMKSRYTPADIEKALRLLSSAEGLTDETFRVLVVGGDPGYFFITHAPTRVYPEEYYSEGIRVTTFEGERYLPNFKTSNLLVSYLALTNAEEKGCFEALLVNRKGYVTEGTRSNFYGIKGNVIYTADDDDVLHGVTRIGLVESAKKLGMDVVYEPIRPESFLEYDSLFITSTSMKAIPIREIDGRPVRKDAHGKVLALSRLIGEWE